MNRWRGVAATALGAIILTLAAGCGGSKPAAPAAAPAPAPAPAAAPKPAEAPKSKGKVFVGYPSIPDLSDAPSMLAWDELIKMGYDVVPKFLATPELLVQAVVRDEIPVGIATSFAFLQARQKGSPLKAIAQQVANEWSLVGRGKTRTLADLEGAKLAQHSAAATGKMMTDALMKAKAPNVKPQVLYVPGSENRADAMIKGTIDATTVELADLVRLQAKLSDLNLMASFAETLPDLMFSVFIVKEDMIKKNPELLKDIIKASLQANRRFYDDTAGFSERVPKYYPAVDQATLPQVLDLYKKFKVYPINGGLESAAQKFTIDFYVDAGQLEKGQTPELAFDRSLLDEVLKDIGKK